MDLLNLLNSHLQTAKSEPVIVASTAHMLQVFVLLLPLLLDPLLIVGLSILGTLIIFAMVVIFFTIDVAFDTMIVVLPTTYRVCVDFVGDIQINATLLLNDVLFVPEFTYDLISVSYLLMTNSVYKFLWKILSYTGKISIDDDWQG